MKKEIENNIRKMVYSIKPSAEIIEDNEFFEGIKAIDKLMVYTKSLEICINNLSETLEDLELIKNEENKWSYEDLFHLAKRNLQEIIEQFEFGSDEDE